MTEHGQPLISFKPAQKRPRHKAEALRRKQAQGNPTSPPPNYTSVNSWHTSVTYFSSTWRQGGHLIASHVFHFTCRTLYTCPNPPEPIFSQELNSVKSKVLSSPMFPWGDSGGSISMLRPPPTRPARGENTQRLRADCLWALPCFVPLLLLCMAPPSVHLNWGEGLAVVTSHPGVGLGDKKGKPHWVKHSQNAFRSFCFRFLRFLFCLFFLVTGSSWIRVSWAAPEQTVVSVYYKYT